MNDDDRQQRAVRIDQWGFETGTSGHGRGASMFGAFLILFGLLLVAGQMFTAVQLGASALFLALGIVLLLMWVRDRGEGFLYVGIFVTALALADLLTTSGVLGGSGWRPLFLGIGVMATVPIRIHADRNWTWPFMIGGLLILWGGSEVLTTFVHLDANRLVGPVLLVLLGVWILRRNRG
jgi:hypothetical protein